MSTTFLPATSESVLRRVLHPHATLSHGALSMWEAPLHCGAPISQMLAILVVQEATLVNVAPTSSEGL